MAHQRKGRSNALVTCGETSKIRVSVTKEQGEKVGMMGVMGVLFKERTVSMHEYALRP